MAEIDQLPNGSGSSKSQRGVVEEVISKRLKSLTKKIIRIRTYGDQSPSSLNNDQRAAMASLPSLEAVARELEDLIKPGGAVEVAELTQAGVLRETRETAAAEAIAIAQLQLQTYSDLVSKRLSQFLRLHTLLHPAKATDLQHLVNGDLDLPSHLREVVTPSDILRVGRMHDDLKAGGDAGKLVLQHLAGSPDHLDSEDTHVLGLLDLVDGSEPEISVPSSAAEDKDEATATATASESTDVNTSVQPQFGSIAARDNEAEGRQPRSRQPTDYSMHTKTSDDGFALGACANNLAGVAAFERERPKAPAPPIKQATPPPPPPVVIAPPIVPPPLNFLQEDELVHKPEKTETEKKTQLEPAADIVEPSSETVQHVINAPEPVSQEVPTSTSAQVESVTTQPTEVFTPKVDWTVDDEDDQTPIFGTRPTSSDQIAPTPPTKDQVIAQLNEGTASTSKPLPEPPVTATSDTPASASTSKSASRQLRQANASGSKRGRGKANGGTKNESRAQASGPATASAQASAPALVARGSSQKVIDEDGFVQVIKKQAAPQIQAQGQGQGSRGGSTRGKSDRGRGGAIGQGQAQGQGTGQRGRGGGDRGRGLPRNPSQSQGQGGAGSDGAGLPPKPVSKPKSSLFKSDVVKQ